MAITIYDVAKEVGTSAVTVSLALRNSKRISVATREKVKETAKRLGYQPNPLARGLVGAKTKTIAFVFNFPSEHFSDDLSYTELSHSVAQVASGAGYKLFVHSAITAKPIREVIADVAPYGIDGIILGTNIENDDDREALDEATVPTVLLGRNYKADKVTCVIYGGRDGAGESVRHLVKLGHRRIAFVGKNKIEASLRRWEGYVKAMNDAGLEVEDELVIESSWDMEAGEVAGLKLGSLANRPTAVIAATDMMAIGVIAGIKEAGLDIPEDISVIGFDNLHISGFSIPALTTVDLGREEVANVAMESLLAMISGQGPGERKDVASSLIVRNSTGICK